MVEIISAHDYQVVALLDGVGNLGIILNEGKLEELSGGAGFYRGSR